MKRKGDQLHPPADPEYEIGYGRPPAGFQFKKGVSGNPNGRPSGRTRPKMLCSDPEGVSSKGQELTDEQLLQLVKERGLSRDALLNTYREERKGNPGTRRFPRDS